MKIRCNESGIMVVATALMMLVVISVLILAAAQFLSQQTQASFQARSRIQSQQVLQEFAVLAQRANEIFNRGSPPGCVLPYTQAPAGRPFCWRLDIPERNGACVQSPLPGGGTTPLCLTNAGEMGVASLTIEPLHPAHPTLVARLKENLVTISGRFLAELSAPLDAQENQSHLPGLGGAPTVNENNLTCGPHGGGGGICVRCSNALVECLDLSVCTRPAGCTSINDWYRQKIAIIQSN